MKNLANPNTQKAEKKNHTWMFRIDPAAKGLTYQDLYKHSMLLLCLPQGFNMSSCKDKTLIKHFLDKGCPNLSPIDLGTYSAVWRRFLFEMEEKDLVLFIDDETCYLSTIASGYSFLDPDDEIYLKTACQHARKLKPVATFKRSLLSKDLRTRTRVRNLIADISEFTPELQALAEGKEFSYQPDALTLNYPLRKDFQVNIQFPGNLTPLEAKCLAAAILSLPHMGHSNTEGVLDKIRKAKDIDIHLFDQCNKELLRTFDRLCANDRLAKYPHLPTSVWSMLNWITTRAKTLSHNPRALLWYYEHPENMPSDCRQDYVYLPTIYVTGYLMCLALKAPQVLDLVPGYLDILQSGLIGITLRGPAWGNAYNYQPHPAVEIYQRAGVKEFLEKYPHFCPTFQRYMQEATAYNQQVLSQPEQEK